MYPRISQCFLTLLSIIWLLSLAILLTILIAWLAYPLAISWLHIPEMVDLSTSAILRNYNHLLSYLMNPFHHTLAMPDFSSSKDGLKHFSDVKGLFHLVQLVFIGTLIPTCYFWYRSIRHKTLFLYQRMYVMAVMLPVLIGLFAVSIGFNEFFTLFHHVLFPGDSTWLFNPYTDPIINILPETFFFYCFLLFFVIYELLMGFLSIFSKNTQPSSDTAYQ
ncbi:TIGR01906 family membrane protein [Streptococcus pluranimalium]